jgi:hypothetical protein
MLDSIKNLDSEALFKIIFCCTLGFFIPVAILFGILALFDIVPANLNDKQYSGIWGMVIFIFVSPIYFFIITVVQWIFLAIGLKIVKWGVTLFSKPN